MGVAADHEVNVRSIKRTVAMRGEPNFQAIGRRCWDPRRFHDERKGIPKPCLYRLIEWSKVAPGKGHADVRIEKGSIAVPDRCRLELLWMRQDVI